MATTENAERFDIGDLPVDVFDLVAGEMAAESLTAGHGMTEYDASAGHTGCRPVASCTVSGPGPQCSCGGAACNQPV